MIKIFLLLFTPLVALSQIEINGTIKDGDNNPLAFANVEIYDEKGIELISYTICNEFGHYKLNSSTGIRTFRVSFIGYENFEEKKDIFSDQTISFNLKIDPQIIDNVIVTAKALDLIIKEDTTDYNLENLTNGSEENLSDILKKLPGINIDKNGKINSNGKKIDNLLIDGKEFFGDQHQLALNNISSEMIKGVSKYENYEDSYDLSNFSSSDKTALNVKIKDKFKQRIKGNSNISAGVKNRYEANANVFSFKKKMNAYLIANSNNLGNQVFTIEDYINFQGGIESMTEGYTKTSLNLNLSNASFLINNDKVEKKQENFTGLNLSLNPSQKLKVNFYTLFDRVSQLENQLSNQRFFDGTQNIINSNTNGKSLYNNTFSKTIFKANDKTVLQHVLHFSINNNNINNNDVFNNTKIVEQRDQNEYSLGQNVQYKRKINKSLLFESSLFHSIKKNKSHLLIDSNEPFLELEFPVNYVFNQDVNNNQSSFGLNNKLNKNINNKFVLELSYKVANNINSFKTKSDSNDLLNDVKINDLENQAGVMISKVNKSFFNYEFGTIYSTIERNKEYTIQNLLPYASIILNFSNSHRISFSYKNSNKHPSARHLIEQAYVADYNTVYNDGNINLNNFETYQDWSLNYNLYDSFSATFINFHGSLSFGENIYTTNTATNLSYISNSDQVSPDSKEKQLLASLSFEKNFSSFPFSLSIDNSILSRESGSFLQNIYQQTKTRSLSTGFKIISNFESPFFNFELGYYLRKNQIENLSNNILSYIETSQPFINLFLNYKKLKLSVSNTINQYVSESEIITRYSINPTLKYHKPKSSWTYSIIGKDILNTSNNEAIENVTNDNYIEERIISVIGGYLVGSIKYKF